MPTPSADQFDAVLLVLDGVPTGTMALHARASSPGFHGFRHGHVTPGKPFEPVTVEGDHRTYVPWMVSDLGELVQ